MNRLLGDAFSAVDAYAFVLCRWTRGFARPARALPNLRPWQERMLARPAVQAYARAKLRPLFDRLGWDPRGAEGSDATLLRGRLIRVLGDLGRLDSPEGVTIWVT